jgi:inner membrane transporter RhtA
MKAQRPYAAILALLLAMISIQTGASLAKGLFPLVGPEGAAALRVSLAAFLVLVWWRPWNDPPPRSAWPAIAVYGLSLGFMNLLFYFALARIPLGIAVSLEFCGPLAVALYGSRRPSDFLWFLCAAAGLLLLTPFGETRNGVNLAGALFALAAGGCWAVYILAGKRVGDVLHGGTATALGITIAALICLPVGVVQHGTALVSRATVPLGLAIAFLSSAFPYSLEMFAMQKLPTRTFGILMSMEPAVAALSAFVLLGEALSITQGLAVVLLIVASAGSTR